MAHEPHPSIGRIVHYRLSEDVVRPAIIVGLLASSIQLQVFTCGPIDDHLLNPLERAGRDGIATKQTRSVVFRSAVPYSVEPSPNTWTWPPRV